MAEKRKQTANKSKFTTVKSSHPTSPNLFSIQLQFLMQNEKQQQNHF